MKSQGRNTSTGNESDGCRRGGVVGVEKKKETTRGGESDNRFQSAPLSVSVIRRAEASKKEKKKKKEQRTTEGERELRWLSGKSPFPANIRVYSLV